MHNEVIFISGYDINVVTDHVVSGVHTSERTLKKTEVVQQETIILITENISWSKKLEDFVIFQDDRADLRDPTSLLVVCMGKILDISRCCKLQQNSMVNSVSGN